MTIDACCLSIGDCGQCVGLHRISFHAAGSILSLLSLSSLGDKRMTKNNDINRFTDLTI